jgi:mono/diheme cytochrome c family protein
MSWPRTLALFSFLLFARDATAAQEKVEVEDLRLGLVVTYTDKAPTAVTQLDPIPALALKPGEAPHPRMRADGGTAVWQGYVNILRAGEYRFGATLRGGVRILLGGKPVFAAEGTEAAPVRKEGAAVRLEAGVHRLRIEYTRPAGVARLELFWKAPHISEEPLPRDVLFHLPAVKSPLHPARHLEQGRFLVEEHNCAGCHRPIEGDRLALGLHRRQGPDLTEVGKRARAGWIYHYLSSPERLSPGSAMPHFFTRKDAVECYAVTRYLESLGGPVRGGEKSAPLGQFEAGKRLFHSVGCTVCHPDGNPEKAAGPDANRLYVLRDDGVSATHPLPDLRAKTSHEALSDFLMNPLAVRPGGRMPNMLLKRNEANALAQYLRRPRPDGKEYPLPDEPPADRREQALRCYLNAREIEDLPREGRWVELGRRVATARNCAACHAIAPGGRPLPGSLAKASFDDIKELKRFDKGCLAPEAGKRGKAPWFALSPQQRDDIFFFLNEGAKGAGSPAPAYQARVALQRFNCLACHQRDGEGGLTPGLVEDMRKYEKAENAETMAPPSLNDVGHKLLTPWFRRVLTEAGRARPWMALRMPQFGPANVGHLPEGMAALEGAAPQDAVDKVPNQRAERIEVGRQLVGKGAFGCISCHDIAGVVTGGTRGPDLATTNQRVRYPWFRRWLESAQRMHPGTKMPTVFPEGKSLMEKVLAGDADAQSEAMWAYLAIGPTLPLPDGIEFTPTGTVLAARDRPVLLRTFLPDAGTRAVAVSYPGGISVAFDGTQCRLAYAWSGGFLDAAPVWTNRGGAPAHVLGTRFWTAPPGFPWSVGADGPHFDEQRKDPAFGVALPEGQVYQGPAKLIGDGYRLDKEGRPTFQYRVAAGDKLVRISERPEPVRTPLANGVSRQFALEIPAGQTLWFLAGNGEQAPHFLGARGKRMDIREASGDRAVVLPQEGDRLVLLQLQGEVNDLRWLARQEKNGHWGVFLRVPEGTEVQRRRVEVRVLVPHRNEPDVLRELLTRKEGP